VRLEEIVRPFQLLPGQPVVPIPSTETSNNKLTVAGDLSAGDNACLNIAPTTGLQIGTDYPIKGQGIPDGAALHIDEFLTLPTPHANGHLSVPAAGGGSAVALELTTKGVFLSWGSAGKMPTAVSNTVGITFCQENSKELTRKEHAIRVTQPTNSDNWVDVAKIDQMTLSKSEDKHELGSGFTGFSTPNWSSIVGPEIAGALDTASDRQSGKCKMTFVFGNGGT
jgi:hypothetical protein